MNAVRLSAILSASAAALAAAALAGVAVAQVQRSGGGANAQLMQQYQQAITERAQLQADNQKMKKDLDALKKQLDSADRQISALKAGASHGQAALAAAQAANENSEKALADSKNKMQELIARFRDTVSTLRGVETERGQLQQQLEQTRTAFDQCAVRNDALYQVNKEVLDRYQHQGAFSYLARAEPFTRIKRNEIDNLALEYRQRAEELRMKKPPSASPSPGGGTAEPAPVVSPGASPSPGSVSPGGHGPGTPQSP